MSWIFSKAMMDAYGNSPSSQALVEEYSAGICSAGEPSVPLSVMPTPHKFWRNDKMIEHCNLSRFGLTCAVLTDDRGEELLTSFLAAFPVKKYRKREPAKVSMGHGLGSGHRANGSFAKWDQTLSLWRTPQGSLLGDCIEYSQTWPKWGSMRNGVVYRRPTPSGLIAHRAWITFVKESGLSLTAPTPTVCGNYNRKGASKTSGDGLAQFVKRFNRSVPTPTATDATKWNRKTEKQRRDQGSSVRLGNVVTDALGEPAGGTLNPAWVEWLMGWPIGWTELKPLAMDKFLQWSRLHGDC